MMMGIGFIGSCSVFYIRAVYLISVRGVLRNSSIYIECAG